MIVPLFSLFIAKTRLPLPCVLRNLYPEIFGRENLGSGLRRYGFISDGGYVECVAISARNVVPLPDSIPYVEAASIGYGLTTAVHAAMAEREVGEWVVVYGVGA